VPPDVAALARTGPEVTGLRAEYRENPRGIDTPRPRLSWAIRSGRRAVLQSGYEIRVAGTERGLRSREDRIWESGKVQSSESTHAGPPRNSSTAGSFRSNSRSCDAS